MDWGIGHATMELGNHAASICLTAPPCHPPPPSTHTHTKQTHAHPLFQVTNHFLSEYAPSAAPDPSEILLCTFATSAGGYELTEHVLRRSADADTAAGEGDMDVPDGGPVDPGTPGSSRKRAGFEEGGAASPSGPASPSGAAALAPSPTKARATGGLLRVSLEQNAAAAVAASGGDPASPSPGGISRRDPRASEDAPGTPTTPMPQMKGDAQLERLYDMGAWVDDGRPMRAVIEERLLLVAQEFADQFAGGRGPGQDPVFVFRNALMHLARISRVLSMDQVRRSRWCLWESRKGSRTRTCLWRLCAATHQHTRHRLHT